MISFRYLVPIGFLLFSSVTLYVATLDLTTDVLSSLMYVTAGGYMLGLLGMTITFVRAGVLWRYVIAVLFGVGTASVVVLAVLPRFRLWTVAGWFPLR